MKVAWQACVEKMGRESKAADQEKFILFRSL